MYTIYSISIRYKMIFSTEARSATLITNYNSNPNSFYTTYSSVGLDAGDVITCWRSNLSRGLWPKERSTLWFLAWQIENHPTDVDSHDFWYTILTITRDLTGVSKFERKPGSRLTRCSVLASRGSGPRIYHRLILHPLYGAAKVTVQHCNTKRQ